MATSRAESSLSDSVSLTTRSPAGPWLRSEPSTRWLVLHTRACAAAVKVLLSPPLLCSSLLSLPLLLLSSPFYPLLLFSCLLFSFFPPSFLFPMSFAQLSFAGPSSPLISVALLSSAGHSAPVSSVELCTVLSLCTVLPLWPVSFSPLLCSAVLHTCAGLSAAFPFLCYPLLAGLLLSSSVSACCALLSCGHLSHLLSFALSSALP
jgi:hypothetical protein